MQRDRHRGRYGQRRIQLSGGPVFAFRAGIGLSAPADAGGRLCRCLPLHPHRRRYGTASGAVYPALRRSAELHPAERGSGALRFHEPSECGRQRHSDQRLLRLPANGRGWRRRIHRDLQGCGPDAGLHHSETQMHRPFFPAISAPLPRKDLPRPAGHRPALRYGGPVLQRVPNLHPPLT